MPPSAAAENGPAPRRPLLSRLTVPASALLWGLQVSFLVPSLALLLVALYSASAGEVGTVLAIYNAGGFVATLLLPAYADRKGDLGAAS